ncbi:uncharacterized protein [Spinacia oleracea]|uniref:Reverse transcriptase domain-containing protein n=1 Tax=Spinacia oleracea TaxID=3562 RepID=A0ABM3QYG2_SPIOL|nr:uncharacterized protein LOC130463302 [Spinacia oleracea]
MDCLSGAAMAVSDELVDSIYGVVNLFLAGKCPMGLGEYGANAPLTPLVKPGGGIRPIADGTVWRCLVLKVGAVMVGPSLGSYFDGLQFGVGVSAGGEAILYAVIRLIEDRGSDVGLSLLLYYGEHTLWSSQGVQQGDPLGPLLFALVLQPLVCKIRDAFDVCLQAWYLDDGTIIGDTLVVGKVLQLIMEDGPCLGLHLNVEKTEVFWPTEDPRSRLVGVFPPDIARPLHGVKLLGGPTSSDPVFSGELMMQRVIKTIGLMDKVSQLDDPHCELLLLRACTGVSKLYFALRNCPPGIFEAA